MKHMYFIIASNNEKKVKELDRILMPLGVSVKTAKQAGVELDDVEETGTTFEENAELKAKAACEKTGMPAIADDSGLVVDALDGRPGIMSARYAGENATDEQKIEKLLAEMRDAKNGNRDAHFVCVICCYFPNGEKIFARGECSGTIGYAPRGNGGFGYDPIFFTEGNKTFAELSETQKDALSHRGKALKQLSSLLKKKLSE